MKALDQVQVLASPNIESPDNGYKALARKLGINVPAQPSHLVLRHVLSTLSIGVYDSTAVRNYLIEKKPTSHFFVWVPVAKYKGASRSLANRYGRWSREWTSERRRHGSIYSEVEYNKPIPYPVLVTMGKIVDEAKAFNVVPEFFVNDYAKPAERPQASARFDPFLAVSTSDSDSLFIIERWDEPGFREEVYSQKRLKTVKK